MRESKVQWERREQEYLVRWFDLKFGDSMLLAASANGGARNPIEAANMKREGVRAGMPDLILYEARKGFYGLCIELKDPGSSTRRKGVLSVLQKKRIEQLNKAGYHACACWGWVNAKDIIEWYLREDN